MLNTLPLMCSGDFVCVTGVNHLMKDPCEEGVSAIKKLPVAKDCCNDDEDDEPEKPKEAFV